MKLLKALFALSILASCVQDKHTKTITFKVNMSKENNIEKVGIRSGLTSPPWSKTIYLTDDDNDSVFEGTFIYENAQSTFGFKFVNQDSIYELKDQNNRLLKFEYKPESILYMAEFNNPKGVQTLKNN
ncbi:hypothetical protein EYD45_01785 [Hyunsoonleella flava]|uniref:Uncharacterized protein n=1 Tax=Hyunsoonleella flava TaxID=2527939 RepID=A0A4Q9FLR1_9FLAO|nr:hypothetical protein [Hyunsoonleella flava]TBN06640.1 hypothetical protein EYD45_01785 [Hyunsoonleella flava]